MFPAGVETSSLIITINFSMRVSSGAITSSWHKVEIGIISQPPIRAFMDDLTVMTESNPGCRRILKGLKKLVGLARNHFKPIKSRLMVMRKGEVEDKFRFNIKGTAIPTMTEKPMKSLGKVLIAL